MFISTFISKLDCHSRWDEGHGSKHWLLHERGLLKLKQTTRNKQDDEGTKCGELRKAGSRQHNGTTAMMELGST